MQGLEQHLLPYIISQVASLVILFAAWKNTRIGRILFALLFFWAASVNMYMGLTDPGIYLEYAGMALPFYRDFINGWFNDHKEIIIPLIAAGQLSIAAGMALKNRWVQWACIGTIVFLLAIAPLMVGSGFPFSITVSAAAWLILKRDDFDYLWKMKRKPQNG
ncbi:MAG TPA: hypothetical protein VIZ28_02440 [Chitinophagaceae bacterium]